MSGLAPAIRRRLGAARHAMRRRLGREPKGLVTVFDRREVSGWVEAPPSAGPVRITLHVNGHEVAGTWVVSPGPLGSATATRRPFLLRIRGVWRYCRTTYKLTVRADGHPLPIQGVGMYLVPQTSGPSTLTRLRELQDEGYVFAQKGKLQLSKKLDVVWQSEVLSLYGDVRAVLAETYGYELFLIYGTLLGAVREGGFIGHDGDFDAAYVTKHTDPAQAATELRDLGLLLVDRGYDVDAYGSMLHVHSLRDRSVRIDVFHLYFEDSARLRFPFGVAGITDVLASDWKGTKEIDFVGHRALIPVDAERVVEAMYGPDWRTPMPGFSWTRDRVERAEAGMLPAAYGQTVYWANYYARHGHAKGSTFFEKIGARPDLPMSVVDIGCGDGRDALAFGGSGRTVLGLDRSAVGVAHARDRAAELGLTERVRFEVCDVAIADDARAALSRATSDPDSPVLFYLRFFLHSVTDEVQQELMGIIADVSRPGDMLAAEFRTDKDEKRSKTYRGHYRRFQNGPAFGHLLRQRYGFQVLEEQEGTGLSVYGDEDPELYRVVARR